MKNEKGITLISLVVTIVILIIITSVAINSGTESIEDVNKIAFISEMEMIQSKVNAIYEERKNDQFKVELYDEIGQDLSLIDENKLEIILNGKNSNGFKYYRKEELKSLGLDNINQEVIINLNTREVINVNGISIDGSMYYTLSEIPDYTLYNVEYINTNTDAPSFTVEQTKLGISEYRFTIKDIQYNSNVKGGTVSYKLHSDTNWILNGENTSFVVNKPGLYDIMFTDLAGNSTIVQKWFYVENGLVLLLDGENNTGTGHSNNATTWKDLSGNESGAILNGINFSSTSGWNYKSLKLDGIDDYGVIQNLDLSKYNDITICSTYKVLNVSSGTPAIICSNNSRVGRCFFGYNSANLTAMNFMAPDSWIYSSATTNLNKINNMVATYKARNNNSSNQIFVNGQSYIENNTTMDNPWENYNIEIGRAFGGGYERHPLSNSEIYNIIIYDRTLTDEEILINYEIDQYRYGIQ